MLDCLRFNKLLEVHHTEYRISSNLPISNLTRKQASCAVGLRDRATILLLIFTLYVRERACVCMRVYIYMYTHTHTHTHTHMYIHTHIYILFIFYFFFPGGSNADKKFAII